MNEFSGSLLAIEDLSIPLLLRARDYWASKSRGDWFPGRDLIDPVEMKPFLAHVMLIDVSREPLDFSYRVFGSALSLTSGKDYTGKSVRVLAPQSFADIVFEQYRDVLETRRPCRHEVVFTLRGMSYRYERLTMPLARDGQAIDQLLAVSSEDQLFWQSTQRAV